jgi:hypothetical protein
MGFYSPPFCELVEFCIQIQLVVVTYNVLCTIQYSNVALFNRAQGLKHEEEVLKHGKSPVEVWGDEAYTMYKRRMAEERRMNIMR